MNITDDTTTAINTDRDEDRLLILNGSERLRHFQKKIQNSSALSRKKWVNQPYQQLTELILTRE